MKPKFVVEGLAALTVLCAVLAVAWFSRRASCDPPPDSSSCDRPVEVTGRTGGSMLWCNRDGETLPPLLERLGCAGCEQAIVQAVADSSGPASLGLEADCTVSGLRPALSGATSLMLGLPIDLNLAARRDLEALPGIGPVLAQKIVQEREKNGPYCSIDELQRVFGVGPTTVGRIEESVEAECP